MKDFEDWQMIHKICLGILVATMGVAGAIEFPKLAVELPTLPEGSKTQARNAYPEPVDFGVLVYGDNGEPLQDAEVKFLLKGSPVVKMTNTDGYARIQTPTQDDIDVEVRKQGFQAAKFNIDPRIDPGKNKELVLKRKRPS